VQILGNCGRLATQRARKLLRDLGLGALLIEDLIKILQGELLNDDKNENLDTKRTDAPAKSVGPSVKNRLSRIFGFGKKE
jgi:hypothetical protein